MGGKPRPKPDCCTCGVCCIAPLGQDRFCDVTEDDIERLPKRFRDRVLYPTIFDVCMVTVNNSPVAPALATKTVHDQQAQTAYTACVCLQVVHYVAFTVPCTTAGLKLAA